MLQAAESASGKAAEAAKFQDKVATLKTQLFDSKSELEKISADLRLAKASSVQAQRKTAILMSEQEKIKKREEEIEIERQNLAVLREASKVLESAEHPTYGKLIADLGYKKVYCANAIPLLAQTQARACPVAAVQPFTPPTDCISLRGAGVEEAACVPPEAFREDRGEQALVGRERLARDHLRSRQRLGARPATAATLHCMPDMPEIRDAACK